MEDRRVRDWVRKRHSLSAKGPVSEGEVYKLDSGQPLYVGGFLLDWLEGISIESYCPGCFSYIAVPCFFSEEGSTRRIVKTCCGEYISPDVSLMEVGIEDFRVLRESGGGRYRKMKEEEFEKVRGRFGREEKIPMRNLLVFGLGNGILDF